MKINSKLYILFLFLLQLGFAVKLVENKIDEDPTIYSMSFIAPVPDSIDVQSFINELDDFDFTNTEDFLFQNKTYSKINVNAVDTGAHSKYQLFPDIKENEFIIALSDIKSSKNQLGVIDSYANYLSNKIYFNKKLIN
jgi:hypothetical protein